MLNDKSGKIVYDFLRNEYSQVVRIAATLSFDIAASSPARFSNASDRRPLECSLPLRAMMTYKVKNGLRSKRRLNEPMMGRAMREYFVFLVCTIGARDRSHDPWGGFSTDENFRVPVTSKRREGGRAEATFGTIGASKSELRFGIHTEDFLFARLVRASVYLLIVRDLICATAQNHQSNVPFLFAEMRVNFAGINVWAGRRVRRFRKLCFFFVFPHYFSFQLNRTILVK